MLSDIIRITRDYLFGVQQVIIILSHTFSCIPNCTNIWTLLEVENDKRHITNKYFNTYCNHRERFPLRIYLQSGMIP